MKRVALLSAMLLCLAGEAVAQSSKWVIDPAHSEVDFAVRHMSVANVHGRIGNLEGTILFDTADATKSSVHVTIDLSTLDTGMSQRDSVVKGSQFFDVAQFPKATFTSTHVVSSGMHLKVLGDLTLHGITRPVELDVEGPSAPVPGMDHKPHSGYSATADIKRKDFGIGPAFDGAIVGDDIKLTIDLEVVEQ